MWSRKQIKYFLKPESIQKIHLNQMHSLTRHQGKRTTWKEKPLTLLALTSEISMWPFYHQIDSIAQCVQLSQPASCLTGLSCIFGQIDQPVKPFFSLFGIFQPFIPDQKFLDNSKPQTMAFRLEKHKCIKQEKYQF